MVEIFTKEKEFKDLIHIVRGQQVMLDSDLAGLYGTEVKKLVQQVKRNIDKFPDDFMFQLTKEESNDLRSHFVTTNISSMSRSNSYVFTEQGIYMIATILKNDIATRQRIFIIREFKKMKYYVAENKRLISYIELSSINCRLDKHEADIEKIMNNFIDKDNIKEKLFLNGEVFDAASAYIKIYKQAKKSIYVINDYINVETLNLLSHKQKQVNVTVFTQNKSKDKIIETEIQRFNEQYPTLWLKLAPNVHDRFIVIDYGMDNELFYVCDASSKDAGKKVCTIIQLHDKEKMHLIIDKLLERKS